jgi:hypothetical protein
MQNPGTSARAVFNPTSIPGLRPRLRRDYYNSGLLRPRVEIKKRETVWRGIRRESTETGEDQTGHISRGGNEAILFFDSKASSTLAGHWRFSVPILTFFIHRCLSIKAQLGSSPPVAC